MAEVLSMPTRGQQLEEAVAALGARTVIAGLYWTLPCPACSGTARLQWASEQHLALVVSCICDTPGNILAQAVGLDTATLAPPPPAATFETLADMYKRRGQGSKWLLEPFVPEGAFTLIQGAPKGGKTFMGAFLGAELARAIADKGHTVLFVEEEGTVDITCDRFEPFAPESDSCPNLLIALRKGFRLDVASKVDGLIAWAKKTQAKAIVLDPFRALHAGDEQDSTAMDVAMASIRRIISETGCAVILVHHTKKGPSWDKDDKSPAQASDSRGSSVLPGAVDHFIAVKGVPASQRVVGQVRFIVECPDSRVMQPFEKRMGVVILGPGGGLSWHETQGKADKAADLLERVLTALPVAPQSITRDDLRAVLRCNMTELRKVVGIGLMKEPPLLLEPKKGCLCLPA